MTEHVSYDSVAPAMQFKPCGHNPPQGSTVFGSTCLMGVSRDPDAPDS